MTKTTKTDTTTTLRSRWFHATFLGSVVAVRRDNDGWFLVLWGRHTDRLSPEYAKKAMKSVRGTDGKVIYLDDVTSARCERDYNLNYAA